MKKLGISLLLIAIISLTVLAGGTLSNSCEYLRIHIRANSNSEIDQNVKYQIKNELISYLTPFISECNSKEDAIKTLNNNLKNVESVCNKVLKENGFSYESKASIRNELFPTRVYGEFKLEEGFYDALIVELGKAKGDNWWCVVYPPLCFTQGDYPIKYKSKILEIINGFKNKS